MVTSGCELELMCTAGEPVLVRGIRRTFDDAAQRAGGLALCLLVSMLPGCGTNIDLGGTTPDAGRDADRDASRSRDGASLVCRYYAPPGDPAPCTSCKASSKGCQANGCYSGWYCDVGYRQCDPAPWWCDGGFDDGGFGDAWLGEGGFD